MSSAATTAIISASHSYYPVGSVTSYGYKPPALVVISLWMFGIIAVIVLIAMLSAGIYITSEEMRKQDRDWINVALGALMSSLALAGVLGCIGFMFRV